MLESATAAACYLASAGPARKIWNGSKYLRARAAAVKRP
jgi:hypothetical protein